MAAADSAGDGTFTTVLYFQTPSATVTPSITSVSPASPIGSNSTQPFTINGNNFVSGCTVTLRDLTDNQTFANRTISSQTSSQIVINPDFTTAADNWSVEVINPGNASSGQYDFTVQAPTVTPSISSVSPATPIGSDSTQPFTINGNNFVSGCTVTLRDLTDNQTFANRTISSQTSSQIVINPDFTTAADNWSVEVINPGSASSGQYDFTVQAPTAPPSISGVSPNPVIGSNSKQTFTVNGSGFVSGAQVELFWPAVGVAPAGNATLPATFVNSSQLQVSATFGNDPATWTAQVINPGNITSSTFNFPLQAPVPIIQLLSPSSASTGGPTFTLTVNGSTFDQGSIVYWNGVSLPTTPVVTDGGLTTVLQAQVPASDIVSAGTATVTVFSPSPGGGTSSGVSFNIGGSSPTTSKGVDYSLNPPNISALKAQGYGFVIRYVSAAGNAKNITSSEAQALQAPGINLNIILVFESTANEMLNGYSAGVADANTAVTTATAAGAPQNFFCYFACDFDAQPSDYVAITNYLAGAASVLGVQRIGFYGGYYPLKFVLDTGKAAKGWQTTAWSSGNIDSRISLYQYMYGQTSAGGLYDIDEGFGSDLGQWFYTSGGGGGSAPVISNAKLTGSTFTLSVPTQTGTNYVLEYKNSMSDANWIPIQTNSGTGGMMNLTNTGTVGPSRFYRIHLQ